MGAAGRRTRNSHTHEYAWTQFLVSIGTHFLANEYRVQAPGTKSLPILSARLNLWGDPSTLLTSTLCCDGLS
jgi:hypothetical protein